MLMFDGCDLGHSRICLFDPSVVYHWDTNYTNYTKYMLTPSGVMHGLPV
jgi:hypothetical protein